MRDLLKHIPLPDGREDAWQGIHLPPVYHAIAPKAAPCWFVDGGNAPVLHAPHFTLQLLRAAAIRFPDKRIERAQEFVLFRKAPIGWEVLREGQKSVFLPTPELGEVITRTRQELEHRLALDAARSGETVVLDGDIAPSGCVALQKTTTILTERGFPLPSVLLAKGPWYAQLGKVAAVKLDERARHVFLAHGATPEIIAVLASYSADTAFPGYPWGLVLADRLARVSHEEAQALRVHARAMLKELTGAVGHAEAATDSHDILDSMG